ncbi:MAG: tRNA (adenosine(37)-N6)-dimethylallyltransferase MiaA [Verrucomicrobiaceae bacterium]|nr:tRNA (adenosine(37)-N6)-dimethylallyltransferase MiaA [Verrucomicrobiaceae bacterium]
MGSVFYLVGPTASGKSAVAFHLAQAVGGELINADAFQLYSGLPICTAQPSMVEQAEVPHHLYGCLPVTESCDAQTFCDRASRVMDEVWQRGRWPIVVGGSGLYIKSLTHGLAPLPKGDPAIRERLAMLTAAERVGELLRLDPQAPENVALANDRYVTRALEICLLTGRPQSELRREWASHEPQFMGVFLQRERGDLYQRINARVLAMVKQGLIDEVQALGDMSMTAEKAIGVGEVRAFLRGEVTLEEAVSAIQQASRRYAKRQLTWFKRERGFQTVCLDADSTATFAVERILELFPCLQSPPPPFVPSSST